MQADLKSGGCPTQPYPKDRFDLWGRAQAEPIFESRAVYGPRLKLQNRLKIIANLIVKQSRIGSLLKLY